ncbi:unnamed protein product [Camellia sinensis]
MVQRHPPPPQNHADAHDVLLGQASPGPLHGLARKQHRHVRFSPDLRLRSSRDRRVALSMQLDQARRKPGRSRVLPDWGPHDSRGHCVLGDARCHVLQRRRFSGGGFGSCGRVCGFR